MDALCISKNGIIQLAAELLPSAGVGFYLNWLGDAENGMSITVTRTNENAHQDRWNALQVLAGERISLVTRDVDRVDKPIERVTNEEMVALATARPKLKPGKRTSIPRREIGVLDCLINNVALFSFRMTSDNILLFSFVWLGDRNGTAVIHVSREVLREAPIPHIVFGDEMLVLWR